MSDFMQGNADSAVQVPFSDDKSEDERPEDLLAEEDSGASAEERITRKAKRQERITRLLHEGKQSKEEAAALKAERAELKAEQGELRERLARLEGQVSQQPTGGNGYGKDPFESELDEVYELQSSAYQAAQAEIKAGAFTEARARHYEGVARDIETRKSRIHTRRELAMREPAARAEQGRQEWVRKYPDVYANPNAYEYAEGRFKQRKALGEVATHALVDEVMAETMATFKLGKKPAPSASERSRMSGVPSSGSGGGGRSDSGLVMTPELRRMAVARYSDLPEPEAIKKWVNGPGKKLRDRKVL